MDRIKIERAIDGLTEWKKHVQTNSDIDRDISTAIEALKAQLSQEDTTPDLISRQQALDIFDDYNISVENGELEAYSRDRKRLLGLPTIQPQLTAGQLNDGAQSTAQSTNLIDRQQALKALRKCQTYLYDARDPELKIELSSAEAAINNLPTIQTVATDTNVGDTISRKAAIDALDFEIVRMTAYCDGKNEGNPLAQYNKGLEDGKKAIEALPSAQPERKTGTWIYDENGMDWNLGAWVCSECHCRNDNIPTVIKFGNEYKRIADPRSWQGSRFCPNCGADMRGEQDG